MRRPLRLTAYLAFVSLGVSLTLLGAVLPALRADVALSYFEAGVLVGAQYIGLAFAPIGGHLADRFGKLPFLVAASAVSALGLGLCAGAGSFPALLAGCVVAGVGSGGYEVGVNALQADQGGSGEGMNLLHFFFGVGAIAGPSLATAALRSGLGWRAAFAAAALLPVIVGAALLAQRPPPGGPVATHDPAALYRSRLLWIAGLGLAAYVGLETSVYGWVATWWQQRAGGALAARLPASLVPSAFWIALTAGRLGLGRLTDRVGLARFVVGASAAALAAGAAWALAPAPAAALACVVLLGLALAGIFPTTVALVAARFPGHSGKAIAFLTVASGIGGAVLPAVLGRLADRAGIGALPWFAALGAAALLACLVWLRASARATTAG